MGGDSALAVCPANSSRRSGRAQKAVAPDEYDQGQQYEWVERVHAERCGNDQVSYEITTSHLKCRLR
jgi:hypothetical protein